MSSGSSYEDEFVRDTGPSSQRCELHREPLRIGLLTGGDDRSYAVSLASSLVASGIHVDFIGSDQVHDPDFDGNPLVDFLNLRGDQSPGAPMCVKAVRLL